MQALKGCVLAYALFLTSVANPNEPSFIDLIQISNPSHRLVEGTRGNGKAVFASVCTIENKVINSDK
jgi:hypothetical protein